jgi:hypothetical protein
MALARAALGLLLGGLVLTAVTIALGTAFAVSVAGGVLLLLPSSGALILSSLVLVRGRTRADHERATQIASAVALASFGLLLFGCSWAVLVHNL